MTRNFYHFGLLSLLMAVALCPAVASAAITTLNNWSLGESDGGALGAPAAATAVDNVGAWNMSLGGSGGATCVAGAYSGSPLAVNFNNPVGGTVASYYNSFGSANMNVPSGTTNWGFDFWFNAIALPTAGGGWQPAEANMVAFGGYGGSSYSNNAIEVELYNQGATDASGNPIGMLYVSNWSGTAWTSSAAGTPTVGAWNHVVYADENGTASLWMNDTLVAGGAGTPVGSNSGYSGNTTPPVADLSTLPANVLVGCRNYSGSIAEGFNGAIDQVRLFTFARGAFSVTDTDPGTAPPPHNPGDANGDKQVDINDLTIVLTNYGQTGMVWSQGDFNGDGQVDINDLTIVLTDYGVTYSAGLKGIKAVPEPGTLALIAAGLAGLLAYAWRKRK